MRLANAQRRLDKLRHNRYKDLRAVSDFWEQVSADKRLVRAKWPALELEKQGRR